MAEGNTVQVAVRVRPQNEREIAHASASIIRMQDTQTIIVNPKDGSEKVFNFDHSFWSTNSADRHFASQEHVFECLGKGVLENAFHGYNACILAYGQTGSGKTYTMMGYDGCKGLIPRLCDSIFARIAALSTKELSFKVEVSFMEIYNEKVQDLLAGGGKGGNLRVREHTILGPYVEGLSKLAVSSFDTIEMLMAAGNKARHTAATLMNDHSSRSHAVFTIVLTQAQYDAASNSTGEKVSRISLVDLAGSERHSKTGTTGDRLKEGANINKSLTTLGLVINALAEASSGKNPKKFVPYRDSTLTWLLKDNLGGNARTVMVATISPASDNFEESMSTLRYADQAKRIVNHAVVNEDPNAKLIRELREELDRLRASVGGGPGSSDGAEVEAMRMKLVETENLMQEMTVTWEEKLHATETVLAEHQRLLNEHGASVRGEGDRALRVESRLPHFVGISDDMYAAEITIYTFREGITTIGSADAEPRPDIVLTGPGITGEMCAIEHKVELDPKEKCLVEVVLLYPLGDHCYIDGTKVTEDVQLRQGSIVQLGLSNYFRFNHPTEALRLRQKLGPGAEHRSGANPMFRSAAWVESHYKEQLQEKHAELEAQRLLLEEEQRRVEERIAAEAAERQRKEQENEALRLRLAQLEAMMREQATKVESEAEQRARLEQAVHSATQKASEEAKQKAAVTENLARLRAEEEARKQDEEQKLAELRSREEQAEEIMRQIAEQRERAAEELYQREIQMQMEAERRVRETEARQAAQLAALQQRAEASERRAAEERRKREELEQQKAAESQRLEEQLQALEREREEIERRAAVSKSPPSRAGSETAMSPDPAQAEAAAAAAALTAEKLAALKEEQARLAREREELEQEKMKRIQLEKQLEAEKRRFEIEKAAEEKLLMERQRDVEQSRLSNQRAKEKWLADLRRNQEAQAKSAAESEAELLNKEIHEQEQRAAEARQRAEDAALQRAKAQEEAERLRQRAVNRRSVDVSAVDSEMLRQLEQFGTAPEARPRRVLPAIPGSSGGPSPVVSSAALADLNPLSSTRSSVELAAPPKVSLDKMQADVFGSFSSAPAPTPAPAPVVSLPATAVPPTTVRSDAGPSSAPSVAAGPTAGAPGSWMPFGPQADAAPAPKPSAAALVVSAVPAAAATAGQALGAGQSMLRAGSAPLLATRAPAAPAAAAAASRNPFNPFDDAALSSPAAAAASAAPARTHATASLAAAKSSSAVLPVSRQAAANAAFDDLVSLPRSKTMSASTPGPASTAQGSLSARGRSSAPVQSQPARPQSMAQSQSGMPRSTSDTFSTLAVHPFVGKSSSSAAIVEEPAPPARMRTATNPVVMPSRSQSTLPPSSVPERPRDMMAEYEKKIIDAQVSWALGQGGGSAPHDPALAAKVGEMIKAQLQWDDTHHKK